MKQIYAPMIILLASIACTVSAQQPANTPAPTAMEFAPAVLTGFEPLATPTQPPALDKIPFATGRVNVRACASTSCKVVGWYEQGGRVVLTGDEMLTPESTECKQWYGVTFNDSAAWVCAAWVAK